MLISKWILFGAGGLLLAGAWSLINAHQSIGEYREKVSSQASEIEEAQSANQSQTETIRALRDRIAELIERRRLEADQREQELAIRDRELARAKQEAGALRREIDDGFEATSSCRSLRNLRVDTACPGVVDRLRKRTDYSGGN